MDSFQTEIRVRYSETDAMGIAHHASYLTWFEAGRVELMRTAGCSYRELERDGTSFPVIEAGLRYFRPSRFDERLKLAVDVEQMTRTRIRFGYTLFRDGELVARGFTEHAALKRNGRPRRMPADVVAKLKKYLNARSADRPSGPRSKYE